MTMEDEIGPCHRGPDDVVEGRITLPPLSTEQIATLRRNAADENRWFSSTLVLRLMAEVDRMTYMWWRGGTDDLITSENGHLIINGSHGCAPERCPGGGWHPPAAEFWTLPGDDD